MPKKEDVFKSCIKRGQKKAAQTGSPTDKRASIKKKELTKVEVTGECYQAKTDKIVSQAASFSSLPEFHRELAETLVSIDTVRKALAEIQWSGNKVKELSIEYRRLMRRESNPKVITKLRKAFEGRSESIVKKAWRSYDLLGKAAYKLKAFPSIKDLPTVIIAGYPNVGKSTIMKGITGSKVKVQPYPFTTHQILVGYLKEKFFHLQIIDTPGVFDRPFEELNAIERRAVTALKYLTDKVVFVFDLAQDMKVQEELLERIKKEFDPDVMVVYNKIDLSDSKVEGIVICANNHRDIAMLREKIIEFVKD